MPELPELEVVREVLTRRIVGRRVERVSVAGRGGPIVIRDLTGLGFAAAVADKAVSSISRRGKYLLFALDDGALWLIANPKLTGRFQLCSPKEKKAGPVHVVFHFTQPTEELRYIDQKRMGQLYLTRLAQDVPTFSEMGPDALDIGRDEFIARLRAYRGEIKGILTRGAFIAGIGNAYADEILWRARLHPYRKRTSLSPEEIDSLFDAVRDTLLESIDQVRLAMKEDIHLKPREFFAVHMRGGQPCPRCGTTISLIGANQRITNFCRECQPGGLIRGM
jgi:formamidopyrimidine-DNA glycosylase